MAGLEKILEEIKRENNEIISNIKMDAEETAKKMIDDKKAELEERGRFMDKKMEKVIKLDIEKGISSAQSHKRKMILEEKQKQIKDMVEKSKEYIKNLPKDEYIEFFSKIAQSRAHSENGTIRLNKTDMERYGEEFVQRINQKLSENAKGTLTYDNTPSGEKTGFSMIYNDVEENCSIEAIFSEKSELIADKMNSFLFA
ncbi:putative ATP synthase, subunit E [Peptostreptococcaceae bacterium AS15]|nr:putative ATP synthase, subunit E [Peptostreptococcaceae bacterium AS15]